MPTMLRGVPPFLFKFALLLSEPQTCISVPNCVICSRCYCEKKNLLSYETVESSRASRVHPFGRCRPSAMWPMANPTVPRPAPSRASQHKLQYSTVTTATQRNIALWLKRFVLKLAGLAPAKRTMMSHPTFAAACQAPAHCQGGGLRTGPSHPPRSRRNATKTSVATPWLIVVSSRGPRSRRRLSVSAARGWLLLPLLHMVVRSRGA